MARKRRFVANISSGDVSVMAAVWIDELVALKPLREQEELVRAPLPLHRDREIKPAVPHPR